MLITNIYAEGAAAAPNQSSGFELIFMMVAFGLIFYFMIFRPQSKRVKEHKNLITSLSKGDEVLTNGGIIGKIDKVSAENDFVLLSLNEETQITIRKDFITAILPKGSMKSL